MTVRDLVKEKVMQYQFEDDLNTWGLVLEDEFGECDCECSLNNLFHCDVGYKENCKVKILKGISNG